MIVITNFSGENKIIIYQMKTKTLIHNRQVLYITHNVLTYLQCRVYKIYAQGIYIHIQTYIQIKY